MEKKTQQTQSSLLINQNASEYLEWFDKLSLEIHDDGFMSIYFIKDQKVIEERVISVRPHK